MRDKFRHLQKRGLTWQYVRRVPAYALAIDGRGPVVRMSLGTSDDKDAIVKRNAQERYDNRLWAGIKDALDAGSVEEAWRAAGEIQSSLGFGRIGQTDHAKMSRDQRREMVDRAIAVADLVLGGDIRDMPSSSVQHSFAEKIADARPVADAMLGRNSTPDVWVSGLADHYLTEIISEKMLGKSEGQIKMAERWPRLACRNFIEVVGDRSVLKITRDDANSFRRFWLAKLKTINPKTGKLYSGDSANRDVGTLRTMLTRFAEHGDVVNFRNPFDGIAFERDHETRSPIPVERIRDIYLQGSVLAGLNAEARAILLIIIETGLRLGEVANLRTEHIRLDDDIPHVIITGGGRGSKRAIKTSSSERTVPLVGVALAAMKKFPSGFPRYLDKTDQLSGALGKFAKEHGLVDRGVGETAAHSLRHSFKDRLREADINEALIDFLMGHAKLSKGKPVYGKGFTLQKKHDALLRIELPFDAAILE